MKLAGERILGTDFVCDIVVYRGAGSYVRRSSALITSIEGAAIRAIGRLD